MFTSIFHTTPEVKSLAGGLLLICVADGMPEEVDPASTLYWTVVCLLPTFLQHCSSQFQEHLVMPPEPTRCQCCSTAQQNMLEWGIDGPTEFAGLLCTKPLMEVFTAQKGVVCCPNEETEPSLWQLLELCSADCSAHDTLQTKSFLSFLLALDHRMGGSLHLRPACPVWTMPTICLCCSLPIIFCTSSLALHFLPVSTLAFTSATALSEESLNSITSLAFSCL